MPTVSAALLAAALSATTTEPSSLEQVLSAGAPEARAAFEVSGTGLIHRASGFRCAAAVASVNLTGVGVGDVPGMPGVAAASCRYGDQHGPDSTLFFSQEPPGREVLSKDYCRALPVAFSAELRRGLPGTNRLAGPERVKSFGDFAVRGQPSGLWSCAWVRAPFALTDEAVRITMIRAPDGWTIRAVQVPQPTKMAAVPITYVLRTIFLIRAAVGAP
jgi:hypothetical protein